MGKKKEPTACVAPKKTISEQVQDDIAELENKTKLRIILFKKCSACPIRERVKDTQGGYFNVCGHKKWRDQGFPYRKLPWGFGFIPDWCPLPPVE